MNTFADESKKVVGVILHRTLMSTKDTFARMQAAADDVIDPASRSLPTGFQPPQFHLSYPGMPYYGYPQMLSAAMMSPPPAAYPYPAVMTPPPSPYAAPIFNMNLAPQPAQVAAPALAETPRPPVAATAGPPKRPLESTSESPNKMAKTIDGDISASRQAGSRTEDSDLLEPTQGPTQPFKI
jgi:hypothetical protein